MSAYKPLITALLSLAAPGCAYVDPLELAPPTGAAVQPAGGGGGSLVGNHAAGLTGAVSGTLRGPTAELLANNAASLVGNNAAGLVANNAASLIGNHAASLRLLALAEWTAPVAGLEVALYDDQGHRLSTGTTRSGADGSYHFEGVLTDRPTLFVRARYELAGQQLDLAATTPAPRRGESHEVAVDPASTLVAKKIDTLLAAGAFGPGGPDEEALARMVKVVAPAMTEALVLLATTRDAATAAAAFDTLAADNPALRLQLHKLDDQGDAAPLPPELSAALEGPKAGVETLAGSTVGFADGPAGEAHFASPYDLAVDGQGWLYVSDYGNHSLRRVSLASGETSTLAGVPEPGCEDGSGLAARFCNPRGLALDEARRTLYVVDAGNARIRVVTLAPDGGARVGSLAGGQPGFADGPGSQARFKDPRGLALDGRGHLYVADAGNQRVRCIDLTNAAHTVSTVLALEPGANAVGQLLGPLALACDAAGKLFVADAGRNALLALSPGESAPTTLAGGVQGLADGDGIAARFRYPGGIVSDGQGGLYLTDTQNHALRHLNAEAHVGTLAGDGAAGALDGSGPNARFHGPSGLALAADGKLYVADTSNHRIRRVTLPQP